MVSPQSATLLRSVEIGRLANRVLYVLTVGLPIMSYQVSLPTDIFCRQICKIGAQSIAANMAWLYRYSS